MITNEQIEKMSLAEYLAALAEVGRKWLAEHPGGFVGSLTQDLAHWAGYGITTAMELAKYLDDCCQKESDEFELYYRDLGESMDSQD